MIFYIIYLTNHIVLCYIGNMILNLLFNSDSFFAFFLQILGIILIVAGVAGVVAIAILLWRKVFRGPRPPKNPPDEE